MLGGVFDRLSDDLLFEGFFEFSDLLDGSFCSLGSLFGVFGRLKDGVDSMLGGVFDRLSDDLLGGMLGGVFELLCDGLLDGTGENFQNAIDKSVFDRLISSLLDDLLDLSVVFDRLSDGLADRQRRF